MQCNYSSVVTWLFGFSISTAVFNKEEDIGTYTVKAVDDPRTLNKILYIRPPGNIYSFNDVVSLWEKKIGKNLERVYVPEDQLLKNIQGASVVDSHFISFVCKLYIYIYIYSDMNKLVNFAVLMVLHISNWMLAIFIML